MNIPLHDFKQQMISINHDLEKAYVDDEREIIYDGCLNYEQYYNSDLRIAWLMKEPYDADGGGWDFAGAFFDNNTYYERLVTSRSRATWQPVAHISYCIQNDYDKYKRKKLTPDDTVHLKKLAWINLQKLPSKNGARTAFQDIHAAYNLHKPLLWKQIEALHPHIIVCANTFEIIYRDIGEHKKQYLDDSLGYCSVNGRLYIDAYHPAQTQISRQKYVDGIVELIKQYKHRIIDIERVQ